MSCRSTTAALAVLGALALGGCDLQPSGPKSLGAPLSEVSPAPGLGVAPPARDWAPVPGLLRPGGGAFDVVAVDATGTLPTTAVEVVRTLEYREGEEQVVLHALREDGAAVVSLLDPDDVDLGALELLAPAQVALWSDAGLAPLPSSETLVPGEPYREVSGALATTDEVVWLESSLSGVGEPTWRLYRGRPGSADVALVARSEDAPPGLAHGPVTDGDRLVWTITGIVGGVPTVAVVSVPHAGGRPRVEARDATAVAATDAGLAVLRAGPVSTGIDLLAPDGTSRPMVRLAEPVPVTALAGDGRILASAGGGHLHVLDADGSRAHRVRTGPDAVRPVVCDGRVVWAPQTAEPPVTAYVLDPDQGTASVLHLGPHTGTIVCGGPFLGWTEVRQTDGGAAGTVVVARWTD